MRSSASQVVMSTPALITPANHSALFPARPKVARDMRPRLLDGLLKCWVCGGEMGHGKDSDGKAYGCGQSAHDPRFNRMISLSAAVLDRMALEAIQQSLPAKAIDLGTACAVQLELKDQESLASLELAQIAGALIAARRSYDEALSRALKFDDSTQQDMQQHLHALKQEKQRLESLDKELRERIAEERANLEALMRGSSAFSNAIERIKCQLPFRAETDDESRILERCRAMLKSIELEKSGEETHDVTVTVRLSKGTAVTSEITRKVVFKNRLVLAWRTNIEYRNSEKLAKLKAAGGVLTDEEYHSLPDGLRRYHDDDRYRQVLDAFARENEEITFRGILRLDGNLMACEHIIQFMLVGNRRALLEKHLQKTRGTSLRLPCVARQTKFSELGHLARAKHPVVLLAIARPGGPNRLTDAQWYAVADEVSALGIQSRYGDDHPRNALDRYFALLRSDLPFLHVEGWHSSDKPWGSLVPMFRMGRHPTKLLKMLDILLSMEGWRLPKSYTLPLVKWRSQKARDYDEALIAEIADTIEVAEPCAPKLPAIERYVCGGLIVNLTEESIFLPDGRRWHTAVRQKRLIQSLMFEGVKSSDYKLYARSPARLHDLMHRQAARLAEFSEELANGLEFNRATQTYRIATPATPLA